MTLRLPTGEPLVDVCRSGVVESVHRGHVAIVDGDGAQLLSIGAPTVPIFPRSANKPLQAWGMLRAGLRLEPAQLALAAASHSGEPRHVEVVASTLADAGLTEAHLGCPPDLPLGELARAQWLTAGGGPDRVHMNCSGKHAAMLSLCVTRGWPIEDYLDPAHPVQRAAHDAVASLAGEPVASIGVDGCGAPLFAISLLGLARAFGRLVGASSQSDGDGDAGLLADTMHSHADLVGGTGRAVTTLMSGVPGLLAKDGAEGVWAAALPGVGAVAVKIDDGAMRAADRVVVAALRRLGVEADVLDDLAELALYGGGRVVGSVRMHEGALTTLG